VTQRKIVVVGATGMLGAATVREWRDHGYDVTALTRANLDVTQARLVADVIGALAPQVLINCTAFNRVDDAEDDPVPAFAVNAWAVLSLARAASACGAAFVHYGTDFVFDGEIDRPYTEADAPNPRSAYGTSKLIGEWMAAEAAVHYVLRVESLFGGTASRSTIDRMLQHFAAGQTVSAFSDRTVSPSHVSDVARATRRLVEMDAPAGLYHCVNSGFATWLEVAERLREWSGVTASEIRAIPTSGMALKAPRPRFAALSNARLTALGIPMPSWEEALARHVRAAP
jgi:dTDP-4-dehydrorhamnose reductase